MYLVDGHNLIPKVAGLSLERIDDERELIELLKPFCQTQQRDLEVFFDGAPPGQARVDRFGRLTVHYVRQGYSADNAIRDRLEQLGKNTRAVIVVSSDRQVQTEAHSRHAAVLSAEAFAARLGAVNAPDALPGAGQKTAENDVQGWLELFGGEPADNAVPQSRFKRKAKKKKPGKPD